MLLADLALSSIFTPRLDQVRLLGLEIIQILALLAQVLRNAKVLMALTTDLRRATTSICNGH